MDENFSDLTLWVDDIFGHKRCNFFQQEGNMSDKTKKVVKATSMCVTVLGITGLVVTGATDADISLAIKVGTGIAAIIGSIITALLPKK